MANLERVARIRDYMRERVPDSEFDMSTWGIVDHSETGRMDISCKSPACIAGHICNYYQVELSTHKYIWDSATDMLELSPREARLLFACPPGSVQVDATPQDAAKVLDRYLETGQFDWVSVMAAKELVPA